MTFCFSMIGNTNCMIRGTAYTRNIFIKKFRLVTKLNTLSVERTTFFAMPTLSEV